MKANELMLGDWYKWYAEGKWYYHKVERKDFADDNHLNFYPVELTKEILELNGFAKRESFWSRYWNDNGILYADGVFDYEIDISVFGYDSHATFLNMRLHNRGVLGMPLEYVHQLQNILRLMGFADLADNFKVE